MEKTVCKRDLCTGCMACVDICPKSAIKIVDAFDSYNAVIDEKLCVNCNACHNVCQNNSDSVLNEPILWKQGFSNNTGIREKASSGGLAGEVSRGFIRNGGSVCSCVFENGEFGFQFADSEDSVDKFVGSKYVKSNPKGVYKKVKEKLINGEKVLFIALPCQVAAMKKYVPDNLQEKLYTVDLICHGTPSPQVLDIFLKQYGYSLDKIENIQFRMKWKWQVYYNYKGIITNGVTDRYLIAFLNSLCYTDNCYTCHYARRERVSDLTLGDSWGSELPQEVQKEGLSLILILSEKGNELLKLCDAHLYDVDIDQAIRANHQLHSPSMMPDGRDDFFDGLRQNKNFNKLVFHALPKQCIRQNVKNLLIKLKVLQGGHEGYGTIVKEK